jgi:hypothetical protein
MLGSLSDNEERIFSAELFSFMKLLQNCAVSGNTIFGATAADK